MIIVQKFGGSSVATTERIMNVAKRIAENYHENKSLVVVLSAMGKTTNELIGQATSISSNAPKRELDMLLVTGEQQSCALMAIALQGLGYPAVSLNASQAGIISNNQFGNARIQNIDTGRIKQELSKKNIVVITGFQGIIEGNSDIATLGRGGSDTTAVAVACALGADTCEIYTDVDGIYTADPNVVPSAIKLEEINYDEMLELASLGAKVLHNRSVEIAKKYNLEIVVKSSLTRESGTIVKEKTMEKMLVTGLAMDKDVSKITLVNVQHTPGIAYRLFSEIANKNIVVDIIVQTMGEAKNTRDISFTVPRKDLKEVMDLVEKNSSNLNYGSINYTNDLVKLSIVGAGMASNTGIASGMFEALYEEGINIEVISTSEIKISVLISEDKAEVAAKSVHKKLIENNII